MDATKEVEPNPARAPGRAWQEVRPLALPCPLGCGELHGYWELLSAHGIGTPPLAHGKAVRERLRGDPNYQAWQAEQVREAQELKAERRTARRSLLQNIRTNRAA